jgi:hypothetical protein
MDGRRITFPLLLCYLQHTIIHTEKQTHTLCFSISISLL